VPGKYDLDVIRDLVQKWIEGDSDKIWFTPRRKSYGAVGFVLNEDESTAQETVCLGLMNLTPVHFYKQQFLTGRDAVADIYGLEGFRGHNWYVKFFVHDDDDDQCVASVSFHPLDHTMNCESGEIL
jgi:hypothetical protein